MVSWQEIWTREYRGRWTARLVPNIQIWTDRKHGELNFFLTQFSTGHGLFYAYLHKMRKVTVPTCPHCQKREDDDALHTFFKCTKWAAERSQLLSELWLTPQINTRSCRQQDAGRWEELESCGSVRREYPDKEDIVRTRERENEWMNE